MIQYNPKTNRVYVTGCETCPFTENKYIGAMPKCMLLNIFISEKTLMAGKRYLTDCPIMRSDFVLDRVSDA